MPESSIGDAPARSGALLQLVPEGQAMPKATEEVVFTDLEEDFFRRGEELERTGED